MARVAGSACAAPSITPSFDRTGRIALAVNTDNGHSDLMAIRLSCLRRGIRPRPKTVPDDYEARNA